jgi:hypothetical protein
LRKWNIHRRCKIFLDCYPIPRLCILPNLSTLHFYDMIWKNSQFLLNVRVKILYTDVTYLLNSLIYIYNSLKLEQWRRIMMRKNGPSILYCWPNTTYLRCFQINHKQLTKLNESGVVMVSSYEVMLSL